MTISMCMRTRWLQRGLTLKGAAWALTYGKIGHWHPLTWLTHMADCQVYGLWAGGHHLTNVALHAMAAVLLFLALREMTGSLWRSAFVAAVFAIHPLRVESVAWIAERKDVLSGVFFMLTLWAYARYARQPSRGRYAAVAAGVCLGTFMQEHAGDTAVCVAVAGLVAAPSRDAGRGRRREGWRREACGAFWGLVKEKIPLFLLSVGSCVATVLVPEKVLDSDRLPFLERLGNALVSYGVYLRQMVFPAGLAIPYLNPPNGLPFWKVALAFVLLAAISISVVACRKRRPYLLVGWLWYLGMLVPAIGIIQISYYAHADRYTYLPGIGLVLAGTWAVGDWSAGWKHRRAALGGLMAAVIGALMVCAWKQTGVLEKQRNLVDPHARLHHRQLHGPLQPRPSSSAKGKSGRSDHPLPKGPANQTQTTRMPTTTSPSLFGKKEEWTKRSPSTKTRCKSTPTTRRPTTTSATLFYKREEWTKRSPITKRRCKSSPTTRKPTTTSASLFGKKGRVDEAITHYQNALQIKPDYADAHNNLGNALLQKGRVDEAITHYQKALQIKPDNAEAHIQPRQRSSAKGKSGRSDRPLPKGAANQTSRSSGPK